MTGPTAEDRKVIETLTGRFEEDWQITIEKGRKSIHRKPNAQDREHDLFALYWWIKFQFRDNAADYMPFSYPIEHVLGSNGIYQWNPAWEVPEPDQKYLKNGILFIPFKDPYLVNDAPGSGGEWSRRLLEITGAGVRLANNISRILEIFNGGGLD